MRFRDADEDACRPRRMSSVYYTSSAREKRRPTTTGLATTSAMEDTRLLVSVLVSVLHEKTCRCRKSRMSGLPKRSVLQNYSVRQKAPAAKIQKSVVSASTV